MAAQPRHDVPMEEEEEEELEAVPLNVKQNDPFYQQPIRRLVDGTEFDGTIVDIEIGKVTQEKLYQIRYNDGDLEHLTTDQVRDCIKAAKKAAGGASTDNAEDAEEQEEGDEGEEEEEAEDGAAAAEDAEEAVSKKKPAAVLKKPVAASPVKATAVRKCIEKPTAPEPKAKAKAKAGAANAKSAPKAKAVVGKAKSKAKATDRK